MDVVHPALARATPSGQTLGQPKSHRPSRPGSLLMGGMMVSVVAAACLTLAAGQESSAGPGNQAWSYAGVFLTLAIVAAAEARGGRQIPIPGFCALVLACPLVQLAPLGAVAARIEPLRSADGRAFSALGLPPGGAISLYPYATVRSLLVIAGSVALFLLARQAGKGPRMLEWLAAGVLVLGLAEIVPALRQWLELQSGAVATATPGSDFMRGTFGNRNLLCAWLEGCYGVALSLALAGATGRGIFWRNPDRRAIRPLHLLAILTAIGCVLVVTGSFSRTGILTLAGETALIVIWHKVFWRRRRGRRSAVIAVAVVVVVASAVMGAGAIGLADRFAPASLSLERQGRLAMWADSIRAAGRRPLLGAGMGCFRFAFRRSHAYFTGYTIDHPHNEYLETVVECGIPFALLVAGWAAAGLRRLVRGSLRRFQQEAAAHGEIALGCLAGVVAILAHGIVDFPLRIPAILGLVAMLLGTAWAASHTAPDEPRERPPGKGAAPAKNESRWNSAWLAATAALGMAALSLWSVPPADGAARRLERWNAETFYRAARADFDQGLVAEAQAGYWRALRANHYAAPVWSDLALVAEAQGQPELGLQFSAMAVDLEPHTRRGQWAAGNLRLRQGDARGALALFEALVSQTPEMRRPVWDACWKAGVPGDQIYTRLTSKFPDDLEDYLRYLLDRGHWEAEAEACYLAAALGRERPADRVRREIFERLFRADQSQVMLRLWRLYAAGGGGFANGDFASPLRGYGLDWAVWPVEGVAVERRQNGAGAYQLDVDFRRPQNIGYSGVIHDFEVKPGRTYRLRFEAEADAITSSSGVQIDVMSLHRRLAVSEAFRRSSGWKTVELRFEPRAGEQVCRMRVIRPPCASFDNQISGRFSLRRVSVEEVGRGQ